MLSFAGKNCHDTKEEQVAKPRSAKCSCATESPPVAPAEPPAQQQLLWCCEMQKSNPLMQYFHTPNEIAR